MNASTPLCCSYWGITINMCIWFKLFLNNHQKGCVFLLQPLFITIAVVASNPRNSQ
jgi:hypothetical protein